MTISVSSSRSTGGYIPGIDGLRAVAILAVLLFHLRPQWLPGGFAGVDIFFVVSGFVVTASLARHPSPTLGRTLAEFYARRTLRILPALLVMLVIVSGLATLFTRLEGIRQSSAVGLPAFFGVSNLVLAFAQEDYFAPTANFSPFLHTWTLGVEEQFYLLFPFIAWFWLRPRGAPASAALRLVAALALGSFAVCGLLTSFDPRYAFYLMPARFWELGAGAALFLASERWSPALAALPRWKAAGLWVAAFAALAATLFAPNRALAHFPFPTALMPVAAAAALLALVTARPASCAAGLLSSGPAVAIGRLSYSLYLWHWPVFVMFRWTVGLDGPLRGLCAVLVATAAAAASYHFVERPFQEQGRLRAFRPGRVLACGMGLTALACSAAATLMWSQPSLASRTADPLFWWGRPVAGCRVAEADRPYPGGGRLLEWRPNCPNATDWRRLVIVGDSHVLSYSKLFQRVAAEQGLPVVAYARGGCSLPHFQQPVSVGSQCDAFHGAVAADLRTALTRDDVLFLPGMRMPHLMDRWTGEQFQPRPVRRERRLRATAEARETIRGLAATGAYLLVQAPLPQLRTVPARCLDWFNRANPTCARGFEVARADLEPLRGAVLEAMTAATSGTPNVGIWDPFPLLCPKYPCSGLRGGTPLFVDNDHLSGRASDLLYADFVRALRQAAAARTLRRAY